MNLIPWYYEAITIIAIFSLLIAGMVGWSYNEQSIGEEKATAKYELIISKQKQEASALLADETGKVLETERKLNELKNQREESDNENKKKVNDLSNSIRILTGAVRLRDPNTRCGQNSNSAKGTVATDANNSSGNGANAGELLSPELNGLLWDRAEKADKINIAFISCKEDSKHIREQN